MISKQKVGNVTEWIAVVGAEILDRAKGLIEVTNLHRLIIHKPDGNRLLGVPLAIAVLASAALTLLFPTLTALLAMAALVTKFQIEIVHRGDDEAR